VWLSHTTPSADLFCAPIQRLVTASAQRGELRVMLDQALEQLSHLLEEVRQHSIIVK
jgi:hypothetical protein